MDRKIDVKMAAQLAEMPVDEFLYLNPQHNRPVIAGADDYAILLPIDKAELFAAKLQLTNQPLVSWQAYRVHNGETLAQIAAKFGLEVEALRAVNGIGSRAKVRTGHTLLVPTQGPNEAAADTLSKAVFTTVPQGRTFYYRVQRGDTLAGVAARYAVSPADIKRWNGLTQDSVDAGKTLRITSDLAPAAGKAKRAAGTSSKRASETPAKQAARDRAAKPSGAVTAGPARSIRRRRRRQSRESRPQALQSRRRPRRKPSRQGGQDGQAARTSEGFARRQVQLGRRQLTRSPRRRARRSCTPE